MPRMNPDLFEALQRVFGQVLVVKEGEEFRQEPKPTPVYRNGKLTFKQGVLEYGETFRVDCPFCGDRRQRLWIPYMWAEEDEETGRDNLHLAKCFNDECLQDPDNREALKDMVWPIGRPDPDSLGRTRDQHPAEPRIIAPPRAIAMPTHLIRIDELSPKHAAVAYLVGRGFDPAELWARWHVSYCTSSPDSRPALFDRIVFPIHAARRVTTADGDPTLRAELAGWQARVIGGKAAGAEPKYLTSAGMAKSKLLYGLPQALYTRGPVVVVEGPTDAWRLGTNAVATLGKDVSEHQQSLLCNWFARRPLAVFLDRDARDKAVKLRRALHALRAGLGDRAPVVVATPPEGREDVGESTRAEAWDEVASALGQPTASLGLTDPQRKCEGKSAPIRNPRLRSRR